MKNAIKLIVLAVVGYAAYEAFDAFRRHRKTSDGPAGALPTGGGSVGVVRARGPLPKHPPMQVAGSVGGAAMTGGGTGVTQRTFDGSGESTATRVGRGVKRK